MQVQYLVFYADEDIKNADGKVIIEKGTLLEKATSDENGKIAFVKDYPFAKYVARELVKPAGYVTNEEAVNFDTKYQGQDVKTAVYNSEYKTLLQPLSLQRQISQAVQSLQVRHLLYLIRMEMW